MYNTWFVRPDKNTGFSDKFERLINNIHFLKHKHFSNIVWYIFTLKLLFIWNLNRNEYYIFFPSKPSSNSEMSSIIVKRKWVSEKLNNLVQATLFIKIKSTRVMTQVVKGGAPKPGNLSSIIRPHMVEGGHQFLKAAFWPPDAHCGSSTLLFHTYKIINKQIRKQINVKRRSKR